MSFRTYIGKTSFIYYYSALTLFFTFMASAVFAADIEIYAVSHGYHSGIVIPKRYINIDYLENANEFLYAKYIEIGFGDKEYYMLENDPTLFQGAKALFWSGGSVMHVVKINNNLKKTFPESNIYKLKATEGTLRLLNKYIFESFKYQDRKNPPLGKSRYLSGNFYDGSQTFSILNTCNTWVAKALEYAGYNINPAFVTTQYSLEILISYISEKI